MRSFVQTRGGVPSVPGLQARVGLFCSCFVGVVVGVFHKHVSVRGVFQTNWLARAGIVGSVLCSHLKRESALRNFGRLLSMHNRDCVCFFS